MTRAFRWRCAGSATALWLLLVAVHAALPTPAQAGCNHPWVKVSGRPNSLTDLALFDPGHRESMPQPGLPRPQDRPGPCAGGACSGVPGLPAGRTLSVSTPSDLWGDLPAGAQVSIPRSDRFIPAGRHDRPAHIHARLERPPRPAPAR